MFRFYAGDGVEPPHVHITGNGGSAKIWLDTLEVEETRGYDEAQMNRIERIARKHRDSWLEAWRRFFGR